MTVYLLGLDGASLNTIDETRARVSLPNFERVLGGGKSADLLSVYPYVTAPAWTSIFSGVNPGKHGIFDMFEIEKDKLIPSNMKSSNVPFLWDYLTWANKKSLIIGVPFVFPAPKINGVFVTGRFSPKLSCYPEDIQKNFDLSGFHYDDLSMEEKTDKLLEDNQRDVSREILEGLEKRVRAMISLVDSENWDAVTLVEGLPDDLLHISYGNEEIIDEMYLALDRFVGRILERMHVEKDSVLIFSDHGFRDVHQVLFMNEWLRSHGYAFHDETMLYRLLSSLGVSWNSLSKPGLVSKVYGFLLKHFPWALGHVKSSLHSSMVVDQSAQIRDSKVTSFSINEPTAWMKISDGYKTEISVDRIESELIELKKKGLLKNIFRTADLYKGKYVSEAPGQVIVEASDGWLIDTMRWNNKELTGKPLFTKRGVHKREGVLVLYGDSTSKGNLSSASVHDLLPTVLNLVGLPTPKNLDGGTLIKREVYQKNSSQVVLNIPQRLQP